MIRQDQGKSKHQGKEDQGCGLLTPSGSPEATPEEVQALLFMFGHFIRRFCFCPSSLLCGCCPGQPIQCSLVYPYPSVSALARGNSDHGPRKTRTKTQTAPDSVVTGEKEKLRPWSEFLGRENSDHGLSFGCFWGRGRRGGSHQCRSYKAGRSDVNGWRI